MIYPVLDKSIMPCIVIPIGSKEEPAKKYLGYKAVSGAREISVEFVALDGRISLDMQALCSFWKTDCKYGTTPFLISLPVHGSAIDDAHPNFLVRFADGFSSDLNSVWKSKHRLIVVGDVQYVNGDSGDYVISDSGDYVIADAIDRRGIVWE